MKNLSQLTRSSNQILDFCRAKRTGVDMMLRKEYRRAKKINYWSKDYTNQSSPNAWFNAKKYKALVLHYQQMRNLHRGTNPISAQNKKQIAQKFTEDAHWQYWNYRNHLKQFQQEQQWTNAVNVDKQISTLPAKLREELQHLQTQPLPQMIQPNFHYSEQYQIYLPTQQKHRKNLILRIQNPPKDKSLQQDEYGE